MSPRKGGITSDKDKKIFNERLDAYEKIVMQRIQAVRRNIEANKYGGNEQRLWLEKFTKGRGLDVCCGNVLLDGAEGVDGDYFSRTEKEKLYAGKDSI